MQFSVGTFREYSKSVKVSKKQTYIFVKTNENAHTQR